MYSGLLATHFFDLGSRLQSIPCVLYVQLLWWLNHPFSFLFYYFLLTMCFWKSYCQYMEQDINKFSLLPISLKTQGTFLWREKGWILLLLGKGRAVQCFICVAKKVTRTGPGKGRAAWQSAAVPQGVCLPCLCSSVTQQETKRSSLFKCSVWIVGIFARAPLCVYIGICVVFLLGETLFSSEAVSGFYISAEV